MMFPLRAGVASLLWMLAIPCTSLANEKAAPTRLTLAQAIDEAFTHSPRIASADAAVKAAEGKRQQADTMPNPELGVEGENMLGSGPYQGIRSADITYGLSQQIELGGKRSAREAAASHRKRSAILEAQMARLDLQRDVKQGFASAVAAQESQRLAEEALEVAGQEMKSVSRRVAEAASPLIQRSKAEVSLATARFNLEQARQETQLARARLATLLGRSELREGLDASSFFDVQEPHAPDMALLEHTPDMQRLRVEEEQAGALLAVEKAAATPDPTVSLGVRELRESSDRAFVMGVSIPLPVLNGNRGNIEAARAELLRTESDQNEARLALRQRYTEAHAALRTAYLKATSFKATVLPAAEQAFTLARRGYGAGKFQYLEVLDAQRTLFDARTQYTGALREYHLRQAECERLSATTEGENDDEAI